AGGQLHAGPHRARTRVVSVAGAMTLVSMLEAPGYEDLNHLTDQFFALVSKQAKRFRVHVLDPARTVGDDDAGGRRFQEHAETMFRALSLFDLEFKIFGVLLNGAKALRALVTGDGLRS